jgi:hypothetical protein
MIFAPAARVASLACSPGSKRPAPGALPVLGECRKRRAPALEAPLPVLGELLSLLAPAHVLVDARRDVELLVGVPAENLLRGADLVLTERSAVRLGRVLRVRRWVRDVAADNDERRACRLLLRLGDRRPKRYQVVHVGDVLDVPAVGLEALGLVLVVEAQRRRSIDRDAVVVVEDEELSQSEGPCERARL